MTLRPLDVNILPSEAADIPLPRPDITPPVTKIYFVFDFFITPPPLNNLLSIIALKFVVGQYKNYFIACLASSRALSS